MDAEYHLNRLDGNVFMAGETVNTFAVLLTEFSIHEIWRVVMSLECLPWGLVEVLLLRSKNMASISFPSAVFNLYLSPLSVTTSLARPCDKASDRPA